MQIVDAKHSRIGHDQLLKLKLSLATGAGNEKAIFDRLEEAADLKYEYVRIQIIINKKMKK